MQRLSYPIYSFTLKAFLFGLLIVQAARSRKLERSSRLVVTFQTARDNSLEGVDLVNITVVKQYGRRLVLDLGTQFDLKAEQIRFRDLFRSVESVDYDYLVGQEQAEADKVIVSDVLTVMEKNTTDPIMYGAYVDPATQTPLWNLMDSEPYSIHAEGAWRVTNSTPDVVVAVIDSGFADIAKGIFLNLLDGYDFVSDSGISIDGDGRDHDAADPGDWGDGCPIPSWHGTKVASILAARHDNEFGMKGVAQNCSVLPVRVLGLCRMGYATDLTDAIVWAAGGMIDNVSTNPKPAKIISLSLAGPGGCPDYLQSAINQAVSYGATIIAAAGNSNQDVSGYFPANCKGVLSVAATTRDGKLAYYSNWGKSVTVTAPGGDYANGIMTLGVKHLENGLEAVYEMGTSFSVPHVAGIGALVYTVSGAYQAFANLTLSQNSTTLNLTCLESKSLCTHIPFSLDKYREIYAVNCVTCPEGYYTSGCSETSSGSCTKCRTCFTNYYNTRCSGTSAGGCSQCVYCTISNTYMTNCGGMIGPGDCSDCPGCPSGQYRTGCGIYSIGSCTGCAGCPLGKYRAGCGGWNAGVCNDCPACPSGKYITACSGSSSVTCSPCTVCTTAGMYTSGCSGTSAGSCATCAGCPDRQYRTGCSGYSAGSCVGCGVCPARLYRTGCSGASVGNCTGCAVCTAGKYEATVCSSFTNAVCQSCGPGRYSNASGLTTCEYCTAGKFSSFMESISFMNCTVCVSGTYASFAGATACTICESGKYAASSNTVNCTECGVAPLCNSDEYLINCSTTAAARCAKCNDADKPLHSSWLRSGSVQYNCVWGCDEGFFRSARDMCEACRLPSVCAFNQYLTSCNSTADGVCLDCTNKPPNSFYTASSDLVGMDACAWSCSDGYRKNLISSKCEACAPGTYAVNSPETCTPCQAGKYAPSTSASVCLDCSPNTYTPVSGASACESCLICSDTGYFTDGCVGMSAGFCRVCTNTID